MGSAFGLLHKLESRLEPATHKADPAAGLVPTRSSELIALAARLNTFP